MRTTVVKFDGIALNDMFTVTDIDRPLMGGMEVNSTDIPGRNGALYLGVRRSSYDVTVSLAGWDTSDIRMRERFRWLNSILAVDEPKPLTFDDEPGIIRYAIPSGNLELDTRDARTATIQVTFSVLDGLVHGETREYSTTGNTISFTCKGSLISPIRLTMYGTGAAFSPIIVNSHGLESFQVSVPATSERVIADSDRNLCYLETSQSIVMPTLVSTFLHAYPGRNTITMTMQSGTHGKWSVAFDDRW